MRTYVLLALLGLTFGCKGKPKHRPPPANLVVGSGSATAGSGAAPDIVLPHGNGSPPKKKAGPLTPADLVRLAKLVFKGFQIDPRAIDPKLGVEVRQKTEDHPRIIATITITQCGNGSVLGDCVPMDLQKWQANQKDLEKLIPTAVRGLPDTLFEIGSLELNKTPMIYVYELGFAPTPAAGSGSAARSGSAASPHVMQSHAYTIFYNDGVNQIRVVSEYADVPKPTREALIAEVPRSDLEAVARSFIDIYTQLW